ncbi:hypothetical protein CLV98_11591 [Dyadobacter jejuensis]|uniref:Uncharacterized protein n=2 Tax=Dyadobacter jejuensis TaxID=1082580 RepID=A0A316ADN0_9BACT|nr:hypothetical protein CLV98_11591 [Dyadobacter jejuensis]
MSFDSTVSTIKERLLERFAHAKGQVGPGWKDQLAASYEYFNTRQGEAVMRSVSQAHSNPKRGHVDRIEMVTIALEKLANIQNTPTV